MRTREIVLRSPISIPLRFTAEGGALVPRRSATASLRGLVRAPNALSRAASAQMAETVRSVATNFRVCKSRCYAAGKRDTRTSLPGRVRTDYRDPNPSVRFVRLGGRIIAGGFRFRCRELGKKRRAAEPGVMADNGRASKAAGHSAPGKNEE